MKEATIPTSREEKNILVALKEVQATSGYISDAAISEVAARCGASASEVYGVATFYSFLHTRPAGRNVIQICQSVPCYLKASENVEARLRELLQIEPGETTSDGRFSLFATNCIGACDVAPAMLVNGILHGNLTPERLPEILQTYK